MKILAVIDSFKGTLSSKQLGEITSNCAKKYNIECDYHIVADGGEGFLSAFTNLSYNKVTLKVHDPLMRLIDIYYLYSPSTKTAYIEMAKSTGLTLLTDDEKNPLIASTYGLGEQIISAIKHGAKHIVVGIGGSATNDCGVGMLCALGMEFFDDNNLLIEKPTNRDLKNIKYYNGEKFKSNIQGISFTVLTDVTNHLLGDNGATYVFSPQKGAKTKDELALLESNIEKFARLIGNDGAFPGAGAAGGVGYALQVFCNARFQLGLHYILDLINFDELIKNYDIIITGEGKIDYQSLHGKVVYEIMRRVKEHDENKKVIFVCAVSEISEDNIYAIVPNYATVQQSLNDPEYYYCKLADKLMKKISED